MPAPKTPINQAWSAGGEYFVVEGPLLPRSYAGNALPTLPSSSFPDGTVIKNSTTGKLMQNNANVWTEVGGGLPAQPGTNYNKVLFSKSDGTLVWQQKERATATFNGSTAQVAATWPDFASRPFAARISGVISDDAEAATVQLVSVTSMGATVQADAPFVGSVEIELEEKIS